MPLELRTVLATCSPVRHISHDTKLHLLQLTHHPDVQCSQHLCLAQCMPCGVIPNTQSGGDSNRVLVQCSLGMLDMS